MALSILGPLMLVTPASGQVVTTAEQKSHSLIEIADDDTLIASDLAAAVDLVSGGIYGHRQILQATYDQHITGGWEGPLYLRLPPLVSVTSVKYYDQNGTQQTMGASDYLVLTPWKQPGSVERAPGAVWPALQTDRRLPITIRYVAGYSTVPESIKKAIKMITGYWYEHREAAVTKSIPKEMEFSVTALLNQESYGGYG